MSSQNDAYIRRRRHSPHRFGPRRMLSHAEIDHREGTPCWSWSTPALRGRSACTCHLPQRPSQHERRKDHVNKLGRMWCRPIGIPVTCTVLYIPPHLVEISSRPLYSYFVVAPTECGPVLSPACLSVSRRRPRRVSMWLERYAGDAR